MRKYWTWKVVWTVRKADGTERQRISYATDDQIGVDHKEVFQNLETELKAWHLIHDWVLDVMTSDVVYVEVFARWSRTWRQVYSYEFEI